MIERAGPQLERHENVLRHVVLALQAEARRRNEGNAGVTATGARPMRNASLFACGHRRERDVTYQNPVPFSDKRDEGVRAQAKCIDQARLVWSTKGQSAKRPSCTHQA
jgi:hypothetical protein